MARITIDLPNNFIFNTIIPIRISDINYGGHVGNDALLSIVHEIRVQFLSKHGYSELNIEGVGLIMSDVAIEFKKESFYGDFIEASLAVGSISNVSFDLFYKMERVHEGHKTLVALAKTGMVCYNYPLKKVCAIPALFLEKIGVPLQG